MADIPEWFPREIVSPANEHEERAVRLAQRVCRITPTGNMDSATRSALRGLQYLYGVPVTGNLDLATARIVDGLRPWHLSEE
jgi:hypothetical protein